MLYLGTSLARLLLSLAAVAAARRRPVIKRRFRSLHGAAACLALLAAAAHWSEVGERSPGSDGS